MKEWNVRAGEPIPREELNKRAYQTIKELLFWNFLIVKDPKLAKAKERMIEIRLEAQEQLDILAPGWAK